MTKQFAWVFALVLLFAGSVLADDKLAGLDGTTWGVEVGPDEMAKDKGEKEFHETLLFTGGRLVTSEGPKLGFESAPYTIARSGDKDWSFTAEQKSSSQGKYVWTGTIHEDDIRGKLVWSKIDKSVLTYTFKGDRKK